MTRSARRGHRDGAGADRGVRAGRVLPGHDRAPLPAVLADDRVRGGAVGVQRADADAGAVGAAAAIGRAITRAGFFRFFERVIDGGTHTYVRGLRRGMRAGDGRSSSSSSARWALTWWICARVPQSFVPDEDPGLLHRADAGAGGRVARIHGEHRASRPSRSSCKDPDVAGDLLGHGVQLQRRRAEHGHRCSRG